MIVLITYNGKFDYASLILSNPVIIVCKLNLVNFFIHNNSMAWYHLVIKGVPVK